LDTIEWNVKFCRRDYADIKKKTQFVALFLSMQYQTISKLFEAYDGIEVCGMFLSVPSLCHLLIVM
jgi:hypothetical protein